MRVIPINTLGCPTQWVYSDCIIDTIFDIKDLGWYPGYKINNPISFNGFNALVLGGIRTIINYIFWCFNVREKEGKPIE